MDAKKNEVLATKSNDFAVGVFGNSENFQLAGKMAETLARSTIVPKDYQGNACNAMVAIDIAQRLQASPLMVMQNLYVIQGRPSWSAQYLIAMINASGRYDFELQYDEKPKDGKPYSCLCWTEKNGRKVTGMEITMDMAKSEGWLDKNGSKWKTMPQLMLRYRAASFFSRLNCPDLTMGLYTREEAYDLTETDYSISDIAATVEHDIKLNANSEDFVVDETVAEQETFAGEVVEEKKEDKPANTGRGF
jgi:hypothetical protein